MQILEDLIITSENHVIFMRTVFDMIVVYFKKRAEYGGPFYIFQALWRTIADCCIDMQTFRYSVHDTNVEGKHRLTHEKKAL